MKLNKKIYACALLFAFFTTPYLKNNKTEGVGSVMAESNQLYSENHAEVINNLSYPTDDVFVADIILDAAHGYTIDNTGNTAINDVLQNAIDNLYANGGGTIYLPAGKYCINKRIDVKPFINIRGDYKDPDTCNGDYGTIIICKNPASPNETGERYNVFRMQGSTALIGLTFYYPNQYIDSVAEYGYTIEIPGGMSTNMCTVYTLQDITFLNSYKAICASITPGSSTSITHEQLHLSNIKGTALRVGAHLTNSSEVGTIENITFSPKYWANAPKEFHAPNVKNIIDFTSKNSIGMIIGDLEWQEMTNIVIEDFHTGIYCIDGTRNTTYHMALIGQFYNLIIKNAKYGVYVEKLYENMGIDFAQSIIEGSEYAVLSNSPLNYGCLKFSYCDLNGPVAGRNIYYNSEKRDSSMLIPWNKGNYIKPTKTEIFNVKTTYHADNSGLTDCSLAIQNALDDAHTNGGGIVYLPAGFYKLTNSIKVYENTQLRGCFNALSQCQLNNSRGTFILAYYGEDSNTADIGKSLIQVEGNNSGVSGLRIACPNCNPYGTVKTPATIPHYRFMIRCVGINNYVTNVYMPGVYNGVEMTNDNFIVKKVLGCFYHKAISVMNGENGLVTGCLSNGACTLKPGNELINDFDNWTNRPSTLWSNVYSLTRLGTTVVTAKDCKNLNVNHLFSFACRYLVSASNCDIMSFNLGFDSQPSGAGAMFELKNNTNLIVFNVLRDNCSTDGTFYTADSTSKFSAFNVILLLPGNAGKIKGNVIENQGVLLTLLPTGSPFKLEKISNKDIDYTFIDYSTEEVVDIPTNTNENNGCFGSLIADATMLAIISSMAAASIMLKKKKERE